MTVGIPFGDPRHPFKPCTETARRAGKKGKAKSPWATRPMFKAGRERQRPNAKVQRRR